MKCKTESFARKQIVTVYLGTWEEFVTQIVTCVTQ